MRPQLLLLALITLTVTASAQDRHFAWSYNSPTLPQGTVDVEAWNTYSFGRDEYYFSQLRQRLEFEFGITDFIQTSVYLNAKHKTTGPKQSETSTSLAKSSSYSFSNSWKFHLLSPYQHPVGLSAYFEYYLAQGETELEAKLMVDRILEKHWFVFNSTAEIEFKKTFTRNGGGLEDGMDSYWKLEQNLGYMYTFTSGFGVGLEMRNVSKIDEGKLLYSALFAGPSIFVGSEKYFLIFSGMPQLANLAGDNTPLELYDQERYAFRVLLGVTL